MKPNEPDMAHLFAQLGLSDDACSVARFIGQHAHIANGVALHEGLDWTPSQASFLLECLALDSEWSNVVDQLNVALHVRRLSGGS